LLLGVGFHGGDPIARFGGISVPREVGLVLTDDAISVFATRFHAPVIADFEALFFLSALGLSVVGFHRRDPSARFGRIAAPEKIRSVRTGRFARRRRRRGAHAARDRTRLQNQLTGLRFESLDAELVLPFLLLAYLLAKVLRKSWDLEFFVLAFGRGDGWIFGNDVLQRFGRRLRRRF